MNKEEVKQLKRVTSGLKDRVNGIVEMPLAKGAQFSPALYLSDLYDEYARAHALKRALLEEHEGNVFEEIFPGTELRNERGTCYQIKSVTKARLQIVHAQSAKERLLSDLKLLRGVRETTEVALKMRGYMSIADLVQHERFGQQARYILDLVEASNTNELLDWIGRRFASSHPLALATCGFQERNELLYIDIETLGLFSSPIIVIGLAKSVGETLEVYQYVLRNLQEEPSTLTALLSHVDIRTAFVTFNGRAFDVPYLEQRLAYYQIPGALQHAHFDVLHFARRKWRGKAPDCRLHTLQAYLFGARKTDIPSPLVPEFYETYLRTRNVGPLLAIVEHNRQDLVALALIFSKICEG